MYAAVFAEQQIPGQQLDWGRADLARMSVVESSSPVVDVLGRTAPGLIRLGGRRQPSGDEFAGRRHGVPSNTGPSTSGTT
eukprot:14511454-Heterocapsa_arctica.AAC.1